MSGLVIDQALDAWINELVAEAPPISPSQLDAIAPHLRPASKPEPASKRRTPSRRAA